MQIKSLIVRSAASSPIVVDVVAVATACAVAVDAIVTVVVVAVDDHVADVADVVVATADVFCC